MVTPVIDKPIHPGGKEGKADSSSNSGAQILQSGLVCSERMSFRVNLATLAHQVRYYLHLRANSHV